MGACWRKRGSKTCFFPSIFFLSRSIFMKFFYEDWILVLPEKKQPRDPTAKVITHTRIDSAERSRRRAGSGWLCAGVSEESRGGVFIKELQCSLSKSAWRSLFASLARTEHSMHPFQLESSRETKRGREQLWSPKETSARQQRIHNCHATYSSVINTILL